MIEFTKMHGLGNDYIYINMINKKNQVGDIASFTRYICNRHFGVGADGVILVKKSEIADMKMEIYNSDGSIAEMCGNGIRCFAKYVYENDLIKKEQFNIETLAGIKRVILRIRNKRVDEVMVNMGKPIFLNQDVINIKALDLELKGTAVSMGNPHFVIFEKNIDKINLQKYGPVIEENEVFPQKTNVEFVEILGNTSIKMRVWERGAGETYACGTGACAVFAVCYKNKLVRNFAKVYLKGGFLDVRYDRFSNEIYMTGLATKVCDGVIEG